jgi:hypothetical protein
MKEIRLFFGLIVAVWILILVTNTKVLLWETKVKPGQYYYVVEHGDLGKSNQPTLVGRYFNGRGIITKVFWYSSNNIFGRDSCPFILQD